MHDPLAADGVSRRGLAVDVTAATLFAVVAVAVHSTQSEAAVVASILVAGALAVRRLSPTTMIVLAVASAAVQVVCNDIAVLASLAYAVVFSTLGGSPDRRVRFGALAAALIGAGIAAWEMPLAFDGQRPEGIGPRVATFLFAYAAAGLVVIGGWTVGFIRFQRRAVEHARVTETIAQLERRRLLDLYDEQARRARLARDMHDVVAHSLAIVVAQSEGARYTIDADPAAARDALGVIADTARDALTDVRTLLEQLRSDDVEVTREDRHRLLDRMRAAGMTLHTNESGDPHDADDAGAVERVAYRVLTEALTNALKYGDLSAPVEVDHDWTDGYRLRVVNTISDAPLAPGGAGHGIIGMAERAAQAGGTLTSTGDGDHWIVELAIPARQEGLSR